MQCPASLADVDLFGPGAPEHWYEAHEILHREAPVHRLPGEGPTPGKDAYILTKYDDIALVVRDPVRFPPLMSLGLRELNSSGVAPENVPNINTMMTLRPTNALYRSHRQELTDPWVGPGASRNAAMIAGHVDDLIGNWIDNNPGEVEFISEFARPLPQRVMNSILGFPQEDIALVEKRGAAQVAPFVYGEGHRNILNDEQTQAQVEALDEFADYVQAHIEDRRRRPQDDMIAFLTQATYRALGRKLTDLEINGIVYAMVIGGLETTQYAIEEQAQLLCERDEEGVFDDLKRDRSKLRHFTEEGLRLRSPTQGLSSRITTQDEVFQGLTVPAGSQLHLRWAAANIDEEEFECPLELKLDRKAVSRHLTFSQGPRVCPGAHLSRLEQVIAWDRLLDRIDCLEYAPGNSFMHQPGIMLGTLELKLRFTKAA